MAAYLVFGLVVDCDLPLSNATPAGPEAAPDVTLRSAGTGTVASDAPAGEVLAELRGPAGELAAVTVLRADSTVTLRLCGTADFDLDLSDGRVTYRAAPGVDDDLLGIFVTGLCLATVLQLRARHLLHASAVLVPDLGGVVALVGSSGMGKSTVATLLAGEARPLFADDILRVDRDGDGLLAHRGTTETRLRPKAADLGRAVAGVRSTADGRTAVPLPASPEVVAPLVAVVVPGPDPAARAVELTRLTGASALFTLLAHPRLVGWQRQAEHTRHFAFLSDLVERVPVFSSRLPWGPPFADDFAGQLLGELRAQL